MSVVFYNGKKFTEFPYESEKILDTIIKTNYRSIFGTASIYIDIKPRISSIALGNSVPDGLLLDLKDVENPEFYLVEAELARHDFYSHIFKQVTKFIAFYRNPQARSELIEKVFLLIQSDEGLKNEFRNFLGNREIFKYLKDAADDSQNILLIIDKTKPELEESLDTYTEWSKMVKRLVLTEYRSGEETILELSPDFEKVELEEEPETKGNIIPTEEYHLQDSEARVREMYNSIKAKLLLFKPGFIFRPLKYYIAIAYKRNVAFIYVRKKKLVITVMLPEQTIRNAIKHHTVRSESEGVQRFFGGECATIVVENDENLDEVIEVLKMPVSGG